MQASKVHLLKSLISSLHGHSRLLILGPLDIEARLIKSALKKVNPTLIVYIDGGLKHEDKVPPSRHYSAISVGDGDSLESKTELNVILPREKEVSDLAFVINALLKSRINWTKISFLGFSSFSKEERFDHFIFNLGEIDRLIQKIPIAVDIDQRISILPPGKSVFSYYGTFSIISLRSNEIKIGGNAHYLLKKWTKLPALTSLGLSNEARGKVVIHHKKNLILYFVGKNISLWD
ncbi:MAG: hypothetical protein ACXVLQ_14585 [Bacteriovorax sp.]